MFADCEPAFINMAAAQDTHDTADNTPTEPDLSPLQKLLVSAHEELTTKTSDDPSLINKLPDFLLIKIFEHCMPEAFLEGRNDSFSRGSRDPDVILETIRLVCKKWLLLARDREIWKDVHVNGEALGALNIIQYGIGIKKCTFRFLSMEDSKVKYLKLRDLEYFLSQGKYLQYIRLKLTFNVIEMKVGDLIKCLARFQEQIRELVIERYVSFEQYDSVLIWTKDFLNLKTLKMEDVAKITDDTLQSIARHCKSIEKLDLVDNKLFSHAGLERIVTGLTNLRGLYLNGSNADDRCVQVIAEHCNKLEELGLKGTKITVKGVAQIFNDKAAYAHTLRYVQLGESLYWKAFTFTDVKNSSVFRRLNGNDKIEIFFDGEDSDSSEEDYMVNTSDFSSSDGDISLGGTDAETSESNTSSDSEAKPSIGELVQRYFGNHGDADEGDNDESSSDEEYEVGQSLETSHDEDEAAASSEDSSGEGSGDDLTLAEMLQNAVDSDDSSGSSFVPNDDADDSDSDSDLDHDDSDTD